MPANAGRAGRVLQRAHEAATVARDQVARDYLTYSRARVCFRSMRP